MGNPLLPVPPKRCFTQTVPHRKRNTANEKDPSAALGMTIREYRFPQRRCEITIISIFAFHLPRGTCSSHRSDRETLSQLSFIP